nr:MAG TPA: hypothetical protein [Caudoviricetes sp.]
MLYLRSKPCGNNVVLLSTTLPFLSLPPSKLSILSAGIVIVLSYKSKSYYITYIVLLLSKSD